MNDLKPVDAERIVKTFGVPDDSVLGYDSSRLLDHAYHTVNRAFEVNVTDLSSAEKSLRRILRVVSNKELIEFLSDLIDVAEYNSKQGDISLTATQLDNCKELRDEIAEKTQVALDRSAASKKTVPKDPVQGGFPANGLYIEVNKSFQTLFAGHEILKVPRYQRSYCWTIDQHEDLWHDLTAIMNSYEKHFMGFIMFQRIDQIRTAILDGQQRLATVLVFLLVAMIRLRELAHAEGDPEKYAHEREALRRIIVPQRFNRPRAALKVKLGKEDHKQLGFMVIKEGIWSGGMNQHLNDAFVFYRGKLAGFDSAQDVNELVSKLMNDMIYIEILVPSEMVAYTLFDSLNNRGIQMAGADIIKNLLLSSADEFQEESEFELGMRWDEMIQGLNSHNFIDFFKAVLIRQGQASGERNLYRLVRETVHDQDTADAFIDDLEDHLQDYQFFSDMNATDLGKDPSGLAPAAESVKALNILGATSHLGLAMAAKDRLRPRDFVKLMAVLLNLEVRYNQVCKLSQRALERRYASIAKAILDGSKDWAEIRKALGQVCPTDADFRSAFLDFSFPAKGSAQRASYMLRSLEAMASNKPMRSADANNLTVEHVLPQKINEWWREHFKANDVEQHVNMIGNMALLPAKLNSRLGQAPVAEKFKELRDTDLVINNKLAAGETWTPEDLYRHQKYLADLAVRAWPVPWQFDAGTEETENRQD